MSQYGGDLEVKVATYFETHDGHQLTLLPIEDAYSSLSFEQSVNPPSEGKANLFVIEID
jgi:hypothetical protein